MESDVFTLGDMFTEKRLQDAMKIILNSTTSKQRHERLRVEIVEPCMARINAVTGRENDSGYFAYFLEHALTRGAAR